MKCRFFSSRRTWTAGTAFLLLLTTGCLNPKPAKVTDLPPITPAPMNEQHPGKVVWHDLITPDPTSAKKFYAELLGWKVCPVNDRYALFLGPSGFPLAGIVHLDTKKLKRRPAAQWLNAISIPDTEKAAKRVKELGGKILNGPVSLGHRGEAVLASDPAGAHFLLLSSASGDPPDREATIGEWLWNEVWTTDLFPEIDFYRRLIDYEEPIINLEKGYAVLVKEGRWRMGVRRVKDAAWNGRWVPVVRVKDPVALAEKAEKLGGTVLKRPRNDMPGATVLIADPSGALIILQQWDFPAEGKEVSP